jgi:hypothetical protein
VPRLCATAITSRSTAVALQVAVGSAAATGSVAATGGAGAATASAATASPALATAALPPLHPSPEERPRTRRSSSKADGSSQANYREPFTHD